MVQKVGELKTLECLLAGLGALLVLAAELETLQV